MKIIYKLSALFFVPAIAYGLISHNFLDNKSKSKLLYDPNPKLVEKDELADKYLEKIFKDDGDSAQKKEDIELGINYLLSKLKKQEEKMLAQKKAKENVQDVALLTPKNNDFKSSEDKKKEIEPIKAEKQAVVIKNDQKATIKKSENSSTDNKKLVTLNSDKTKVYEFSKNEKVNQTKAKSQPQPQSEQKSKNLISNLIADKQNKTSTDKVENYNRFYDNNTKTDVVAYEKAKFKDMVQKIEASRSERNKKLSEEF
jgi:hypothetical protein